MAPRKSILWRYFEKCKNTPEFSQCLLCPRKIKTSGNTSNLKCHLQGTHPKEFESLFKIEESNKNKKIAPENIDCHESNQEENIESITVSSPSTSSTSAARGDDNDLSFSSCSNVSTLSSKNHKAYEITASSPSTSVARGDDNDSSFSSCSNVCTLSSKNHKAYEMQPKITQSFKSILSWSGDGTKFNRTTTAILYMICKDFQPISVVEDEGFKYLMRTVAPQYKIPSRKTISTLLDKKYDSVASVFKNKLEGKHLTITTDIWTDMQTRSYLGVTVHFGEGAQIHSGTLGVIELDDRHTSEYIVSKMENVLIEWNETTFWTNIFNKQHCNTFNFQFVEKHFIS